MIGSVLRLILLGVLSITMGWAFFIVRANNPKAWLPREMDTLSSVLPSGLEMSVLKAEGLRAASFVQNHPFAAWLPANIRFSLSMALAVVQLRLIIVLRFLPIFLLVATAGFLFGLILRERIRYGRNPDRHYSSPALALLAKPITGISILLILLFALTPIRFPYGTLYGGTLFSSLGLSMYVGNLPQKL